MATAEVPIADSILPMVMNSPYVTEATAVSKEAMSIVVRSIVDRTAAAELGRGIAQLDKQIEDFFKPMKEAAFKAHREICKKETEVRGPLEQAKKYLSSQIGTFDAEQERIHREEEARLQREADAEAERLANLQAQDQAIEDAIELEAEGDTAAAEAVLNNPVPVVAQAAPVIVERQMPKVAGVSKSSIWKFRIDNPDEVPRLLCIPDEKAIGNIVKALRGKTKIPGVTVFEDHGARFRA